MKKKSSPGSRFSVSDPVPHKAVLNWHNVPERDLWLYAGSFHKAAKKLAGALELDSGWLSEFDTSPVMFMYRHVIELHLKALVLGEGSNFLATKPDHLSIYKTHSVSWLAQFVCQIVTALKWEKEFKCEGIENLADFKAIIEELNAVDPGSYVFRLPVSAEGQDSVPGQVKPTVREFGRKMDALLELLDSTTDALAAEWEHAHRKRSRLRPIGTTATVSRLVNWQPHQGQSAWSVPLCLRNASPTIDSRDMFICQG